MEDIGTFTEPKNKTVPLLPWEPRPSEVEVQKNDSLALIIEILYLRRLRSDLLNPKFGNQKSALL